jgi:hypothetical protein
MVQREPSKRPLTPPRRVLVFFGSVRIPASPGQVRLYYPQHGFQVFQVQVMVRTFEYEAPGQGLVLRNSGIAFWLRSPRWPIPL